jgi:hypothetical protein
MHGWRRWIMMVDVVRRRWQRSGGTIGYYTNIIRSAI